MKTIYYKTNTLIDETGLPFYFGCVHINGSAVFGRHYKPKKGKLTETHIIGYYEINGNSNDFLKILEQEEDEKIDQSDFETLLAQWEQASKGQAVCWGPGQMWEIGRSAAAA